MKKRSGFTLIELLSVIIIMGIILTLVVPSISDLITKNELQKYDYHVKVLDVALDSFVSKNKTAFANGQTCYNLPYTELLKNSLVKEDDVLCTGTVQLTRIKTSSNFTYEYFLTCQNDGGDTIKTSAAIVKTCFDL